MRFALRMSVPLVTTIFIGVATGQSACTPALFDTALATLSASCCPDGSCATSSGLPTTCSPQCAAVWSSFETGDCFSILVSQLDNSGQPDSSDLATVSALSSLCGGTEGSNGQPYTDPNDATQVVLANGQTMPWMSFGFEIYSDSVATSYMGIAFEAGVRNFFASVLANNQVGVSSGIDNIIEEGGSRADIFVCGSVTQCHLGWTEQHCYEYTRDMCASNLVDLDADYVDQIMLDYPPSPACSAEVCTLIKAQWRAFEEMLSRGETLGLAVSNYCPCHLDCILNAVEDDSDDVIVTKPVVNQLKYHIGMGPDPHNMIADNMQRGILLQAYSPLSHGSSTLLSTVGPIGTIAATHDKTPAQVAYKWVLQNGVSPCFSADDSDSRVEAEFTEDMGMYDWSLSEADMDTLNSLGSPSGLPASCYNSYTPGEAPDGH